MSSLMHPSLKNFLALPWCFPKRQWDFRFPKPADRLEKILMASLALAVLLLAVNARDWFYVLLRGAFVPVFGVWMFRHLGTEDLKIAIVPEMLVLRRGAFERVYGWHYVRDVACGVGRVYVYIKGCRKPVTIDLQKYGEPSQADTLYAAIRARWLESMDL